MDLPKQIIKNANSTYKVARKRDENKPAKLEFKRFTNIPPELKTEWFVSI